MSILLRELRKERGWTQAVVSERSGIPVPDISAIENGKKNITMRTLRRLADALDCSMRDLIADDQRVA